MVVLRFMGCLVLRIAHCVMALFYAIRNTFYAFTTFTDVS